MRVYVVIIETTIPILSYLIKYFNTKHLCAVPGGYKSMVQLCTYQCKAPLPHVRAEVEICTTQKYKSPPTGATMLV